jgi:hypothetical protein
MASSRLPQQPATYANAEIRGRLRLWKEQLARQYRTFDSAYRDKDGLKARLHPIVADFVNRSSPQGRRRAFVKLARAFGPAVTLEGLRLDGAYPMAVWSILKPRESVTAGAPAESGLAQDCVTVNCLLAGRLPNVDGPGIPGPATADGLWSLEIPDHALGRAIERSGGRLPDAIIAEAHHNVLRLRQDQLTHTMLTVRPVASSDGVLVRLGGEFLVRAGDGGFICELILGPDGSSDDPPAPLSAFANSELTIYARANTWISEDMLRPGQVLLVDEGAPGQRLGEGWLLPRSLRSLSVTHDAEGRMSIVCHSWERGLPALLAKPAGRARRASVYKRTWRSH